MVDWCFIYPGVSLITLGFLDLIGKSAGVSVEIRLSALIMTALVGGSLLLVLGITREGG